MIEWLILIYASAVVIFCATMINSPAIWFLSILGILGFILIIIFANGGDSGIPVGSGI